MLKYFLLLAVFMTNVSFATIWITVADERTNKIGAIGASSGPIGDDRTMVIVDNKGIAVIGSYVLSRRRDSYLYELLRNPVYSAEETAREFSEHINQGPYRRRVTLVTSAFEVASVAGRGCHSDNYYCGEYVGDFFAITGGGLVSKDVISSARKTLEDQTLDYLPLECKMYKAMQSIFDAGGEKLLFNRLVFMVDDISRNGDVSPFVTFRKDEEESLLKALAKKIKESGVQCY